MVVDGSVCSRPLSSRHASDSSQWPARRCLCPAQCSVPNEQKRHRNEGQLQGTKCRVWYSACLTINNMRVMIHTHEHGSECAQHQTACMAHTHRHTQLQFKMCMTVNSMAVMVPTWAWLFQCAPLYAGMIRANTCMLQTGHGQNISRWQTAF